MARTVNQTPMFTITNSPVASKIDNQLVKFNQKYDSRINSLISSIIDYQRKSGYINSDYTKELITIISIFCLGVSLPNSISSKEYEKLTKCLACHKIDANFFFNLFGINILEVESGVGKDEVDEGTVYEKYPEEFEKFDIQQLLTKKGQSYICHL